MTPPRIWEIPSGKPLARPSMTTPVLVSRPRFSPRRPSGLDDLLCGLDAGESPTSWQFPAPVDVDPEEIRVPEPAV